MHDEFRVQVETQSPGAVIHALKALQDGEQDRSSLQRLAVTHEGDHIFMYADSAEAASRAREVVQQAMAQHSIAGEATVLRWHPVEEHWEDASTPLPSTEAEREAEHARLEHVETEESLQAGEPEWEVYISVPTHHDAREFAERLRGEGIPTKQLWRHLLVGANDEDDATALAKRLRIEAPEDSEIHAQINGREIWRTMHPYAYLGGLGN
jgi:hypothetical protein